MKIYRHFLYPNNKIQLPLHYQFGNFRYSFGYFHTSSSSSPSFTVKKRQLLLLYNNPTAAYSNATSTTLTTTTATATATTTSLRLLPTSYNSSYRSLYKKFLPVVAAPTLFVSRFRLKNLLIDFGQQRRPYNKSVLNCSQSLKPCLLVSLHYRHSQQLITSEYQWFLNKNQKRLHQSFRKMVWPTEHDRPQNADGSEVF